MWSLGTTSEETIWEASSLQSTFSIWKIIQLVQKVETFHFDNWQFAQNTTESLTEIRVYKQLAIMIALLYTWIKGIYSPTFCNCYHLMLWREKQGQQRFPPCMRKGAPHILPREDKSRLSTTPTLLYLPWRQTFSSHWVHV